MRKKSGLPRCKNLTRFSLFVSFCFAVRYCLKCFCFLCFTSSVSFTGSFTEVKPLFFVSLLRYSSLNHYTLNAIFYNCKALTGFFVDLVFTPERLKFPFRLSISVVDCRRHILPSCMVAGKSKIFIEWKNFSIKSFVLNNSVFCTFSFLLKIVKCEALLSPRVWNKSGFHSKSILFPIR